MAGQESVSKNQVRMLREPGQPGLLLKGKGQRVILEGPSVSFSLSIGEIDGQDP